MESSLSTVSETEDLRQGPDVRLSWFTWFPSGGILTFQHEGRDYAKNIRLQCSTESGWRPILRPEVIASLAPGEYVRVVDKGYGQSITQFIHSLPSKEYTMAVTFEERLGVMLARDFRVVAIGTHAQEGVIFHVGALRKIGAHDTLTQSEAREPHPPLHALGEGHRKGHAGKKPVRRNPRYERIYEALSDISKAQPTNHEEVFQALDGRKVPVPNGKPFKPAGSWLKGFQKDKHAASAWLSQVWARLRLPAFARGPKK